MKIPTFFIKKIHLILLFLLYLHIHNHKNIIMNEVKTIRDYFSQNYSYVAIYQISDQFIANFLEQTYIKDLPINRKVGCLYDHLISQGLCDVTE